MKHFRAVQTQFLSVEDRAVLPADFAVTELWQVLKQQAPGRTSAEQVTEYSAECVAVIA